MRVETNEKLARRNRKLAQYLFFATFGVLLLGMIFINQQAASITEDNVAVVTLLQTAVLPIAFITTIISVRMTNLWVRQPRPEAVIAEGLKGIVHKGVLYNYYHFPARHVLVSPQGVLAIVTRFQDGRYTVEGDKWTTHKSALSRLLSIFRFDNIGNPTADALRAADHVKALLAPIAPDVEVIPVIVFTSPKAEVNLLAPTVPVVLPTGKKTLSLSSGLKEILRSSTKTEGKGAALTPEQIEAFEQATLPN